MLGKTSKANDDEDSIPSWLKGDESKKAERNNEQTPLIAKDTMTRNQTSYGGQSASSQSNVEEDYGETTVSWAKNTSNEKGQVIVETISGSADDYEESETDEEESVFVEKKPLDPNWQEEPKRGKRQNRRGPRRGPCHSIFVAIQVIAVLANLSMIATQIVPIIICDIDVLQKVIRCYLAFFSFLFLLAEFEVGFTTKSNALTNWITRGFLYTFIGIVTMEQHVAMMAAGALDYPKTKIAPDFNWNVEWASLFINLTGVWMVGLGILYFLMGLFCLKRWREGCREDYKLRVGNYQQRGHEIAQFADY